MNKSSYRLRTLSRALEKGDLQHSEEIANFCQNKKKIKNVKKCSTKTVDISNSSSSFESENPSKPFEDRNLIKKVKTYCLKYYIKALTHCLLFNNKKRRKWKIAKKSKIFKMFKSDISKIRNRIVLNLPMHKIMETFSNINLKSQNFQVKEEFMLTFNFLLNMKWKDLLLIIKKRNLEFLHFTTTKNNYHNQVDEINKYLSYICQGGNFKERVNIDKIYLNSYNTLTDYNKNFEQESQIHSFEKDFCAFLEEYQTIK
jgi:hypothetical protein